MIAHQLHAPLDYIVLGVYSNVLVFTDMRRFGTIYEKFSPQETWIRISNGFCNKQNPNISKPRQTKKNKTKPNMSVYFEK